MTLKKAFISIGILIFAISFGQSRDQLEKENIELKRQIQKINSNISNVKKSAQLSLAYLNDVNKKINLREKVYNNTQKEKKIIEDDIYLKQLEINRQKRELAILRKNYADVLVNAYKNKGLQNKVTFILSSKNIGEALRRVQYLKAYSDYQNKKAAEIMNAAQQLQAAVNSREKSVQDKQKILISQQNELLVIEKDKKQKEDLLIEFKKNEAQLTAELKQKQSQQNKLEGKIRSIIEEEIRIAKIKAEAERKAREERERLARIEAEKEKARIEAENRAKLAAAAAAKRRAEAEAERLAEIEKKKAEEAVRKTNEAAKSEATNRDEARRIAADRDAKAAAERARNAENKAAAARAAEEALNRKNEEAKKLAETRTMKSYGVGSIAGNNFSDNRGRIGFPVDNGQVTHRFGRQPHPIYKNIVEENNGIKIAVAKGTKAKCVFPGTVSTVLVDSGTKTVIVRHGEYFTIYSNLSDTSVSPKQVINAGTPVGTIAQDFDGTNTLDFQIWYGRTPIDPLGWISY